MDNVKNVKNIILYGPPGTGKTHSYQALVTRLENNESVQDIFHAIEAGNAQHDKAVLKRIQAEKRLAFVSFHQSYAYEDFVEGWRPKKDGTLEIKDGLFKELAYRAADNLLNKATNESGGLNFTWLVQRFADHIADRIDKEGKVPLPSEVWLTSSSRWDRHRKTFIETVDDEVFIIGGFTIGGIESKIRIELKELERFYRASCAQEMSIANRAFRFQERSMRSQAYLLHELAEEFRKGLSKEEIDEITILPAPQSAPPQDKALADRAADGLRVSVPDSTGSRKIDIAQLVEKFADHIKERIDKEGKVFLLSKRNRQRETFIEAVDGEFFIINGPTRRYLKNRQKLEKHYRDFLKGEVRESLRKSDYYFPLCELLKEFEDGLSKEEISEITLPAPQQDKEFEDGLSEEEKITPSTPPQESNYYLIIDEINRGNISKIFGELITLIEEDKRDDWERDDWERDKSYEVTLPYSRESFTVPCNLYIIATMNSSDKSIATIDIALRRRFTFVKMPVNLDLIKYRQAREMLRELNKHIKGNRGEDYQIGHAYLMKVTSPSDLHFVAHYKIRPLLEEYFYADKEGYKTAWEIVKRYLQEEERVESEGAVSIEENQPVNPTGEWVVVTGVGSKYINLRVKDTLDASTLIVPLVPISKVQGREGSRHYTEGKEFYKEIFEKCQEKVAGLWGVEWRYTPMPRTKGPYNTSWRSENISYDVFAGNLGILLPASHNFIKNRKWAVEERKIDIKTSSEMQGLEYQQTVLRLLTIEEVRQMQSELHLSPPF